MNPKRIEQLRKDISYYQSAIQKHKDILALECEEQESKQEYIQKIIKDYERWINKALKEIESLS